MMNPHVDRLIEMLHFRRPAFSVYDDAFIDRYIRPYQPHKDGFGNLIIDVGNKPDIIWSSHTDTVHHTAGLQDLLIVKGIVSVKRSSFSNCLGADCTTGVWMMLEMLDAGVEGRYIFHRDEEAGGTGSKWLAKNTPDLLKGINAAIAFDRKGKSDIVTTQGGRTASDEFATSLGSILGGGYKAAHGMFTDTKSYAHLVSECSNISVGYEGAHSANETQDLEHAMWLRNQMVKFKSTGLVIKRTPEEPTRYSPPYYSSSYHGGTSFRKTETIFDLIRDAPTSTAKILEALGFTFETLKETIALVQTGKPFSLDADQLDSTASSMKDVPFMKTKKNKKNKKALTQ